MCVHDLPSKEGRAPQGLRFVYEVTGGLAAVAPTLQALKTEGLPLPSGAGTSAGRNEGLPRGVDPASFRL